LTYRQLNISHVDFWSLVPYLLFLVFLWTRARLLKSRVVELVDLAAYRAGLQRVMRRGKNSERESAPQLEIPENAVREIVHHSPEESEALKE
jgi:hypothetical protein